MKRFLVLMFAVWWAVAACAPFSEKSGQTLRKAMGIDVKPEPVGDTPPQVSYSAEVLMARAEGYYSQRRFDEAAEEYGRFMELHAAHPWAPYALFRQGMSYVHQMKSADRDPALPQQARHLFESLLANYPDSAPEAEARKQLQWVVGEQAQHELLIARFYMRTGRTKAALGRLERLFSLYPGTPAVQEGMFDLGRARETSGDSQGAAEAYAAYLESGPEDKAQRRKAEKALARLKAE